MRKFIVLLILITLPFCTFGKGSSNHIVRSENEIELRPANKVTVGGDVNIETNNEVRWEDSAGGEYAGVRAPSVVSSSYTLTLPGSGGPNGYSLKTDASGNLSWEEFILGSLKGAPNGVAELDGSGLLPTSQLPVVPTSKGGLGGDFSSSTGVLKISSGTVSAGSVDLTSDVASILPGSNGGTGVNSSATFPTSGTIMTRTATEDISGKTFLDALLLTELGSTPSTPSAGDKKIYCLSTDDKCYQLNDAGVETELGGGTGTSESVTTVSANYTITDSDGYTTILVDNTAATRVVTLPSCTGSANDNRKITLKNTSTQKGIVRGSGSGAQTIDGMTHVDIDFKDGHYTVQCNGTNWFITNENLTSYTKQCSPTITATNWTTRMSRFFPSRDISGNWKVLFQISGVFSAGVTLDTLVIDSVVAENVASAIQTCDVNNGTANWTTCQISPGGSGLGIFGGTSATDWAVGGVLKLDSKPGCVE